MHAGLAVQIFQQNNCGRVVEVPKRPVEILKRDPDRRYKNPVEVYGPFRNPDSCTKSPDLPSSVSEIVMHSG
jgi:hypothetical protein